MGLSRIITLLTRSPYYHAGLYAGDGHVVEMRTRGVLCRPLDPGPQGDHFVVLSAPDGKGEDALAWARTQIGDKYDGWDLLVILLNRVFTHLHLNYTPSNTYTCAEFVAVAFDKAGVRLLPDIPLEDTEPADLGRLVGRHAPSLTVDNINEEGGRMKDER